MSVDTYTCSHCGQWLGITGPGSGTDDDFAAEEHYASEVDYHERGECTPVAAVEVAPTPDPRAEYIAGLRALADLLETRTEIPLPMTGTSPYPHSFALWCPSRDQMQAAADAFEDAREGADGQAYRVMGKLRGLHVHASATADMLDGHTVTREVESFEVEPFLPQSVSA